MPKSVKINSHLTGKLPVYTLTDNTIFIKVQDHSDSISLEYRVLPYKFSSSDPLLSLDAVENKGSIIRIESDYTKEENYNRRFIQSNKLNYSGSFSRGINFGNTQDLVLNSDFDLQMSGDLGNGLLIRAAISDDNIPIQPEGNTQVLQEFDKVFIEIEKDSTAIIAGDYELARPDSYFMNYYKKLKGFSLSNTSTIWNGWRAENRGSFAISRGKFKRLTLLTQEGNQGPYKLEGDAGEVFLQVLSGTEKIFADGRLLKRGDNYDYIIDYNRAEVRFTANMVINANIRIIVEYEYATQNYLRSLYATESSFSKGNWTYSINLYNEQDSKSQTGNVQLDSTDINILVARGDSLATKSGLYIPEGNDFTDLTKYQLENGILVHAPTAEQNVFAARFSNFGTGKGNYIIDTEADANGRVYKYQEGGDFSPEIQLIAPEKKQLITTALEFHPSDSTNIYFESAMSTLDKNRYSQVNNQDNLGGSFYGRFSNIKSLRKKLKKDSLKKESWHLNTELNVEYKLKYFQALNPYRAAEFFRDWNFATPEKQNDQLLYNTAFTFSKSQTKIGYVYGGFSDKDNYLGYKNGLNFYHNSKKWLFNGVANLLNSKSEFVQEKTSFLRPNLLIKRKLPKKWNAGIYFEKEENLRRGLEQDSLKLGSFNYDLYRIFLGSEESKPFHVNAAVTRRNDERIITASDATQLSPESVAIDYTLGGGWRSTQLSDLKWNLTYREYEDLNTIDSDDSKQTLIGTIEHSLTAFKKGLTLNSYYESNSGQEPKLEFQYIEVQRGEGSYVWVDSNMDSLKQIFEFEIAAFADNANYEKVSVFNNEFISSNKSILNQSLKIIPKKFLSNKKHFLGRFQLGSRYRIDQRSKSDSTGGIVRPIITDISNEDLISFSSSMDHDVFFDRGNTNHDIQLSYRTLNNKITQVTGFERRGSKEYYTRSRYNIQRSFDLLLETSVGTKILDSNFDSQNFEINYWRLVPQLNYRPSANFRIVAKYKVEKSKNLLDPIAVSAESNEQANLQDIGLELTWRKSTTSNLQFSTNLVNIDYQNGTNPALEFEMLQGLKDGTNYLWNLNYTRRIAKNFDMILTYNARKSEGSKMVNNAGAQLRAVF